MNLRHIHDNSLAKKQETRTNRPPACASYAHQSHRPPFPVINHINPPTRVLFFLPWESATIVGTTDSESELTMTPKPTDEEVNFIIQVTTRGLVRDGASPPFLLRLQRNAP